MKTFLTLLALAGCAAAELVDVPALGVRVEHGFRISQIADEQLANDIWSITLNPRSEIVVSGAGYIRTLLDTGGDGRMDKAVPFAEVKGAMGLCFSEARQATARDGRRLDLGIPRRKSRPRG